MGRKRRRLKNSVYEKAYKDRDKGGASRQGYIDWKECTPKDKKIKFYSPREGTNKINIIPYEIKSKNHPSVKAGEVEVGDLDYMLDIWVHRYIGSSNADIVCPKKNYRKSCPICDKGSEYYEEGKKEESKKLYPTRRVLINVQPIIKGETADELQIFDVSHWLFAKELVEEAHECKDGKDIILFADIETGKVVKFRMSIEDLGKMKSPKFKSFVFLEREEELDDELIDEAISFDAGIKILSEKEIEKIFYGQEEDEDNEEEDDPPKKESRKDEDDEEEERPAKKKRKEDNEEEDDKKSSKCPEGYKWGEADDHKECNKCKKWDDCDDYADSKRGSK